VGDFADAAWWASQILGNSQGVVRLSVKPSLYGDRPSVVVVLSSASALRAYVERLGPGETDDINVHADGSSIWSGLVGGIDLLLFTEDPAEGAL
jgi:hypothetical protein